MVNDIIELMRQSGDRVRCRGGSGGMKMVLILGFLTLDEPL